MGNRITFTVSLSRQKSRVHRAMRPLVSPLRARRERPRRCRAAEKGDEIATPHSITSSARNKSDVGKSPTELAEAPRLFMSATPSTGGQCNGVVPAVLCQVRSHRRRLEVRGISKARDCPLLRDTGLLHHRLPQLL